MSFIKKTFFIISILLCTQAFAQFGGDEEEDPDEGVPIDGGISILAVSGTLYATYRYFQQRK